MSREWLASPREIRFPAEAGHGLRRPWRSPVSLEGHIRPTRLARCVFTRRVACSPRPPHRAGDGGRAAARGQRPRPACPCLPIPTSWRRLQAHSATAPQSVHAVRAVPRAWWRLGGATHRFLVLILLRLPAPRGANSFLLPHSAIEVVRLHGGSGDLSPLAGVPTRRRDKTRVL